MTRNLSGPKVTRGGRQPLPRSVWILSWVSFFADVSSEIVYPILPFLAVGAIGLTRTQLGIIEGLAVLLVSLIAAYSGVRSDWKSGLNRLFWIRIGYGLPIAGKLLISVATNGWQLAGGRLIDRLGKGLRGAPRDALLADVVPPAQRGQAFGLHRALDTAGALTGVISAALIIQYFMGSPSVDDAHSTARADELVLRGIVLLGAVLGMASVALTWQIPISRATTVIVDDSPRAGTPLLPFPRAYWNSLAVVCLFSLANSSDAFILLRATELGFTPRGAIILYALYNIIYAALSYPIGVLSDRLGRRRIMFAGWTIYACVYLGFAIINETRSEAVWGLMGMYGVYMALTDGVGKAWIVDLVLVDRKGAGLGYFYCMTGLATLLASLMMGAIWDWMGAKTAFLCAAILAGAAALTLIPSRFYSSSTVARIGL
jgi:MFS family permease